MKAFQSLSVCALCLRWGRVGLLTILLSLGVFTSVHAELKFTVLAVQRESARAGRGLTAPREVILIASRPKASNERWVGRRLKVFRLEHVDVNLVESFPVSSVLSAVSVSAVEEEGEGEPEELSLLEGEREPAGEEPLEPSTSGEVTPGAAGLDEEGFEDEDELDETLRPTATIEPPMEAPPEPLPPTPLPPPPPPMLRNEIGVLEIKWSTGRLVRAEVVYDGLSERARRSSYAVMRRDLAGFINRAGRMGPHSR
ncbi:MAG: hypothetical protein VYD19_00205 [Myxococcota bacterium]|nr:hypothetical protein [Myxococcota bacterium]